VARRFAKLEAGDQRSSGAAGSEKIALEQRLASRSRPSCFSHEGAAQVELGSARTSSWCRSSAASASGKAFVL